MLDQDHNHMKGILDQYEVVECLGKGCQGTSYKLRRRDNLEYFVLKMIECRSLDHGYLLFEEFIHIQKFIHPYVPRILEIHMSMNPKNSAIYVSVIRSYIDLPSLDFIIKDNIEKSRLEWSLIYRMFGSVLTVITSLKKANCGSIYFHPGNIFLSDKGFFMTDIWGPNLMNYARGVDIYVQSFEYIMNPDLSGELAIECHADELPRRRLPRYIEWCAPETSRFEFTDKSDVWTLGCVITILIYIKCLFKNKEILAVDQLKAKENVFHHLSSAEELETHKELFKLLSQMMKNNPSERISLNDLLDDLYVQVLMKHTNPEFIMRAKRCIVTAAEKPFPVNDTMEAKIKYLHDNWQHENCIEKAVVWFAENILNDKHINLTHRLSPHLFDLMYLHQANLSIITSSLRILAYSIEYEQLQSMSTCSRYPYEDVSNQSSSLLLLSSSSSYRLFKESNYFKNICKINNLYLVLVIMKKHLQYVNVQRLGLEFFKSLININYSTSINLDVIKDYLQTYNTIFKKLHTINLCHHLIELLNCTTNKEMIKIGISYLWKFCIYEPIALQAADKNTLSITTQLMESNQFDCEIFTNGSMVIVSLLRIRVNIYYVRNRGTHQLHISSDLGLSKFLPTNISLN
uniref:non-specific serine/threonine protein kinase n=1 Tax=Schistosoma mansoni TaxID=6183 RepID=A0A5K4FAK1_SCHMA